MDSLSISPAATAAPQAASLEALGARARASRSMEEIDKTAREFEKMALSQMMAMMETETDISDSMFGGGAGERMFKPFLNEQYAQGFADRGGIGIAEAVKREMLKMQERATTQPTPKAGG